MSKSLYALEVVNSHKTTFEGAVNTASRVVLTDTVDRITFNGGLHTDTFTVNEKPFALDLNGDIVVANGINLANTGSMSFGGAFTSTNQPITLGHAGQVTTLSTNTSFDSGTATSGIDTANTTTLATAEIVVVNGATAGSLQIRFASEVAASNAVLKAGSHIVAHKIV